MSGKKFAMVTGCGRGGIGHALARQFREKGFDVIATLLPHETRDHLTEHEIRVFDLDVTNDEGVRIFKESVDKIIGGRLDVLVNNAGICYTMTAVDTDLVPVEKMFAVNVFGPMRMVRYFHREIIATKGIIINIGSIGGICPFVFGASYNASKAALHHYGNTLRVEMLPFGVRVMNVISGEVSTNILKSDFSRTLPAGSVYEPMEEAFQAHVQRTPKTITPDQYAAGVVNEAVKKSPPVWFWHGAQTTSVRMLDALFPRTIWDFIFYRMFNLGRLVPKPDKMS